MEIKQANEQDKNRWNDFVIHSNHGSFLQSWQWGDFQASLGYKIFRFKITEGNKIIATALIIKQNLPYDRCYLYSPWGPVLGIQNWNLKIGQNLLEEIKHAANKENAIFLRFEPKIIKTLGIKIPFGFHKSHQVQPKNTLILNLEKKENEILAQMHHKARYNIKLALKKGVRIRISNNNQKDLDDFYDLLSETARKNKIKIFPNKHYQKLLEILGQSNMIKLFLAQHQDKIIAAIIVSYFGKEANYLHGASLYQARNLMAPHLLQWEAIREAKKRNCAQYDFWGVAPEGQPKHKWAGITRFKKGFGGEVKEFIGSLDLIYQPLWYQAYKIANFFRKRS